MTEIPQSILSDHFQDRLSSKKLIAAVFVTYQYDPGFFEQEILPVFLDVAFSHLSQVRLVQLEDELRRLKGDIAVYYDYGGLVSSDSGSAHLDTARIPVRNNTGVFHPKNVFLLVEYENPDEYGQNEQSLLVASMSANLTRTGWWSNIECCHVEEIYQHVGTRLKDDLLKFSNGIKSRSHSEEDHKALNKIQAFLGDSIQLRQRSSKDRIRPHFYSGDINFCTFLRRVAGTSLNGCYLEIISPFFDKSGKGKPLDDILRRFKPRETRIFLPLSDSGEKIVKPELYQRIQSMPNVHWGKLPTSILSNGKGEKNSKRFVHAKMYRFFTLNPKREFCFVGSVNLTNAAHMKGSNVESGFLIELKRSPGTGFWLELDDSPHHNVFEEPDSEKAPNSAGTPLNLRYDWISGKASAFWDLESGSPQIILKGRDGLKKQIESLQPGEWVDLSDDLSEWLKTLLAESTFLEVVENEETSILLIQEDGMSHKPSMLLKLSIADILRYWALLTSEQRNAFIQARGSEFAMDGVGLDLVTKFKITQESESFFDRFAGIFHSFSCLEQAIAKAIESEHIKEAEYRLFGKKYDSLSSLLEKVGKETSKEDPVESYLILLCTQQLMQEIEKKFQMFWNEHSIEATELQSQIDDLHFIRDEFTTSGSGDMSEYLDWFDSWFLSKAPSLEESPID